MVDKIFLKTTVQPSLIKLQLFIGASSAIIGILLLGFAAIFMRPSELKLFGVWIFLLSSLLIGGGLIPYKRLKALERSPCQLEIMQGQGIRYIVKNKTVFEIPFTAIEAIDYHESRCRYGILLAINKNGFKRTLLLPFFSRHSFDELYEIWKNT